jgi:hypothetical protein
MTSWKSGKIATANRIYYTSGKTLQINIWKIAEIVLYAPQQENLLRANVIAMEEHRLVRPSPFDRENHNHSELEIQETDTERE